MQSAVTDLSLVRLVDFAGNWYQWSEYIEVSFSGQYPLPSEIDCVLTMSKRSLEFLCSVYAE